MSTEQSSDNAVSILRALSQSGLSGPVLLIDRSDHDEITILFATDDVATAFGIPGLRPNPPSRVLSKLEGTGPLIRAIRSLPFDSGDGHETTVEKSVDDVRKRMNIAPVQGSPHLLIVSRRRRAAPADIRFRRMVEVLEAVPSFAAYVNRDLRIVYVNKKYSDFRGIPQSKFHGLKVSDFPGDEYEQTRTQIETVLQGKSTTCEIAALNQEGERVPIELSFFPDFDERGKVAGYFCHGNDLRRIRANEMRLRMILDNIAAEVVFLSSDFRIRYANRNFSSLLNTTPKRLTGNNICRMVAARGWTGLEPHLERAVKGELFKVEHSFPSIEDGSQRVGLFHFVPEFLKSPNGTGAKTVTGIFVLIIDISEIKRIQDELNRTKTRFELAVEDSSIGIWEGDVNDEDWIDAFYIEKMLGLKPGSLKNSRSMVRTRIHPDDVKVNERERGLHELGHPSPVAEIRMRAASGEYKWFYVAGKSQRNAEGKIIRLAGTMTDIDRLKKAEIAAEEQLKRRDEFLAMLSHELRNPVTAITYSAGLLKDSIQSHGESFPGADEIIPATEIISRQTGQMSRLLDDLLNVARITQNRIAFDFEVHDFNVDVQSVVESMKQVFQQRNQQLNVNWHRGPMIVYADAMRLKQALANLLDNASKYTPPDGTIELATFVEDSKAVFTVSDNGQGLPPEISDKIFELFFQQPQTIERKSGGLGVGLFIVKNIVESHRGTIQAFSEGAGKGSSFEFRLPLFKRPESAEKPEAVKRMFDGQRLMLVEDNDDSRCILARILERRGLEVIQFSDGESAAAKIEELKPQVALIDIGLPGKNGYELATEIRSMKSLEGVLLIALTGYGQEDDRSAAVKAGFDRHLTKPTNPSELCDYIASKIC